MIKERHRKIFWSKVKKTNSCWLWTGAKFVVGYGLFGIRYKKKTGKYATNIYYAHRLSYEISKGQIPKNMLVLHKCDNRCCVNPAHLFLGTWKDNSDDMIKKGRHVYPGRKLTDEQVREIRIKWPQKSMQKLADEYNVSLACIRGICRNRTWRHLM